MEHHNRELTKKELDRLNKVTHFAVFGAGMGILFSLWLVVNPTITEMIPNLTDPAVKLWLSTETPVALAGMWAGIGIFFPATIYIVVKRLQFRRRP